jgi:hypothetical protein
MLIMIQKILLWIKTLWINFKNKTWTDWFKGGAITVTETTLKKGIDLIHTVIDAIKTHIVAIACIGAIIWGIDTILKKAEVVIKLLSNPHVITIGWQIVAVVAVIYLSKAVVNIVKK